jgi:hypothetical protein
VLRNTIAMIKPGTTVELQVIHKDGSKAPVKAKLGELPSDEALNRQRVQRQRQLQQQRQQRRQ